MNFQKTFRAIVAGLLCCSAINLAGAVQSQTIVDLSVHTNLKGAFLIQQPEAQNLRVDIFFEVGESDNAGSEGLSHYVEHLVASNADRVNRSNLHARSMNAWANNYFTNYHNVGPHTRLPVMMDFAAGVFRPFQLDQGFMRSERDIVEREFDFRVTENPRAQMYREAMRALYPGHAHARSTIGSRQSIRHITVEEASTFHQQNYSADRATLLISGNLSAGKVVDILKQDFADLPIVPHAPRAYLQPLPAPQDTPVVIATSATTKPLVVAVVAATPLGRASTGQDIAIYDLLRAVLVSSAKGGLVKPLYFDEFWVEEIQSRYDFQPDLQPQLLVWAVPDPDVSAVDLVEHIDKTLLALARDGIPVDSFKTVQTDLVTTRKRLSKDIAYQRRYAHMTALHLGTPLSLKESISLLETVTVEQLNAALSRFAESSQKVSAIAYPKE